MMKSKSFFIYAFCNVLLSLFLSCSKYESDLERTNQNDNRQDTLMYQLDSINSPNGAFPNGQWVLVDLPCTHFSQLLSLRLGSEFVGSTFETTLAICIGIFDKFNRIISKPRVYYINVSSTNSEYTNDKSILCIDVSSNHITINEGEIIALYGYYKTGLSLLKTSSSSGKCFISSEAPYFIPKSFFSGCEDISFFEYKVSVLTSENDINDNDSSDNHSCAAIRSYSRVAFIGTSYVKHPYIPDWKVEKPRSMAASVDSTDFTSMIMKSIKKTNPNAISTIIADGVWQINYDDFDYESHFGLALDNANPDLFFLVTAGNSTYSSTFEGAFEKYLKYLKSKCPSARIIVLVGWYTTQKRDVMIKGCNNQSVEYVDLIDINEASTRWRMGDWYVGKNGGGENNELGYYCFSSPIVVGVHANDLGFCIAAHRCLQKAEAGSCIELIHNISINCSKGSGFISTPNCQWVTGGLVSLRLDGGVVDRIDVRDDYGNQIETSKQKNGASGVEKEYYLFFMPNSNVEVKAEFI